MNEKARKQRIARFMADETTSRLVYEAMLDTYLEERAKLDVHEQAAERIAINLLRKAWKKMETYRATVETPTLSGGQPGL